MSVRSINRRGWKYTYPLITGICTAAIVFSFGLAVVAYFQRDSTNLSSIPMMSWPTHRLIEVVTLALWVVLPPLGLWLEYFCIYRRRAGYTSPDPPPPDWEMFKYAQDLAAKLWLAISTALLLLYFGKDIRI